MLQVNDNWPYGAVKCITNLETGNKETIKHLRDIGTFLTDLSKKFNPEVEKETVNKLKEKVLFCTNWANHLERLIN